MGIIQERYSPTVIGVNATVPLNATDIGGFAAVTAGTITIVNNRGATVLNAFPVSAGVYYPLPMMLEIGTIATFTTAGGASGTIFI